MKGNIFMGMKDNKMNIRKFMKILILVLIFCLCLSSVTESSENEKDSFQQFINYFTTGNPFKADGGIATAKIFNRKSCVAGFEDNNGGYMKIYWNNIDVNSIRIQDKFRKPNRFLFGSSDFGEWQKYISFSGQPYVVDVEVKNFLFVMSYAANGLTNGQHSAVSIPLGAPDGIDDERLVKALQLLYSKHCRGLKRKSAF